VGGWVQQKQIPGKAILRPLGPQRSASGEMTYLLSCLFNIGRDSPHLVRLAV